MQCPTCDNRMQDIGEAYNKTVTVYWCSVCGTVQYGEAFSDANLVPQLVERAKALVEFEFHEDGPLLRQHDKWQKLHHGVLNATTKVGDVE